MFFNFIFWNRKRNVYWSRTIGSLNVINITRSWHPNIFSRLTFALTTGVRKINPNTYRYVRRIFELLTFMFDKTIWCNIKDFVFKRQFLSYKNIFSL